MNDGPLFFLVQDVQDLHAGVLERYGGQDGMRDLRLLESAVAAPRASYDGQFLHEDLFAMAAAYAFHISENQPFLDGNKRAGLTTALAFLYVNGIDIHAATRDFHHAMIALSSRRMTMAELADLFRSLCEPAFAPSRRS
ncbi:MAG: Fic family protein [Polyangiaceae bacterium]